MSKFKMYVVVRDFGNDRCDYLFYIKSRTYLQPAGIWTKNKATQKAKELAVELRVEFRKEIKKI